MSKKTDYAIRRDLRLRRDKTAALLMSFFLQEQSIADRCLVDHEMDEAAQRAVYAADALLAELDRTRPDIASLSQGAPAGHVDLRPGMEEK